MTCAKQDRCEHGKYCQKHIGDIITTCYFFEQKEPLNNFERITSSPEKLAEFLSIIDKSDEKYKEKSKQGWLTWLKLESVQESE